MNAKIFSISRKPAQPWVKLPKAMCIVFAASVVMFGVSCKKLISISDPITSITSDQIYTSDALATAAMAGVYTQMINGTSLVSNSANTFSNGLGTYVCGMSADEITPYSGSNLYVSNTLIATNAAYSIVFWNSCYKAIYGSNAVIEGIAASTSGSLHDSIRTELTAEAKFVRAFSYVYLVSYFGDVPLVLTTDVNQTMTMSRTSKDQVWQQVIQDLKDAQTGLADDYRFANGERWIPNKWAATALLARAYLYSGDDENAATQASAVIGNATQYSLVSDLNSVFLKNSQEAIWQLQQNVSIANLGNATPEGDQFIPLTSPTRGLPKVNLDSSLINSFETGDKRKQNWINATNRALYYTSYHDSTTLYYFPYKYKTATYNRVVGGAATEYYMVLRLGEQYLIRAEAEAKGANGGASAAIADLNIIRARAGLTALPASLSSDALWKAVAHERQDELFCEWGHRWFDLTRMGLAHDVLSNIAAKQPWMGDYQLLYPIPIAEIQNDHNLTQNAGY